MSTTGLWMLGVLLGVSLARAAAAPLWVNIQHYGAVADDGQLDTGAVRNAIEAVNQAGGGTVYFPPGVWELASLPLTTTPEADMGAPVLSAPVRHVRLVGAGQGRTWLTRRPYPRPDVDQRRLMVIADAEDFTLAHLSVDMNQSRRYGGIAVYGCQGCTIQEVTITDRQPAPLPPGYVDRYALVFSPFGGPHRRVVLLRNTIEHLGVELDNVDGALILGNTFQACASTACIGSFHLADHHVTRNVHILENLIVDPRKSGILVGWDRVRTQTTYEQIRIARNTVRYTTPFGANAIRVGIHDNRVVTVGNAMRGVVIEENRIEVAAGLPLARSPLLFGNNSVLANLLLAQVFVRYNRLVSSDAHPFVDIRTGPATSTVTVYENLREAP